MNPYKTLDNFGTFELVEKKSRFIAAASPAASEDDAREFIGDIRTKNKTANHNVYAYIIGENMGIMRFSDDGEPSGTSGIPVLNVLKSNGIVNAVIVVTRYFGGVLLGASGLVRAYGSAAGGAVSAAGIVERKPFTECLARVDYSFVNKVNYELELAGFTVVKTTYEADVIFEILAAPERCHDLNALLLNISSGNAEIIFGGTIMR